MRRRAIQGRDQSTLQSNEHTDTVNFRAHSFPESAPWVVSLSVSQIIVQMGTINDLYRHSHRCSHNVLTSATNLDISFNTNAESIEKNPNPREHQEQVKQKC